MTSEPQRSLPATARAIRTVLKAVPESVWHRLGRNGPVNSDGEPLASEIAGVMRLMNRLPDMDFADKPVPAARKQIQEEGLLFADTFPSFAIEEELLIPSAAGPIPATRYRAADIAPRGVIVYFHGGGWVLGNRLSTDSAVRFLAVHTGADVVSVDYRLAPEDPFPAAIDDALAAYEFTVAHCADWGIDPDRIVVAGDSAGANISAVISQLLRAHPHRPAMQVLFCPSVDLSSETPSYTEFADGYFLTRKQIHWYKERYLAQPSLATDPKVSPLLAEDLSDLPPAYIGVAGFDPLRDEGIVYATRLREAGNTVTLLRAGALIHPYVNLTGFSSTAKAAVLDATNAIVATLGARP